MSMTTALETMGIWSSIKAQIRKQEPSIQKEAEPYIDPWLKRNSCGKLSQTSLEICTESLCSEATGCSDHFDADFFSSSSSVSSTTQHSKGGFSTKSRKGMGISAPRKSFPPPLSSMSRLNGTSGMKMQAHRVEGRLIVQTVHVPAPDHANYLHAQRHSGRLLLTFKPRFPSTSASVFGPDEENGTVKELISTVQREQIKKKMEEVEHIKEENQDTGNEAVSLLCHVKQTDIVTASEATLATSVNATASHHS